MPANTIKGTRLQGFSALTVRSAVPNTMGVGALAKALSPKGASALTPAAAKLTKADLVALNSNTKAVAAKLELTATDLSSIKKAFSEMRVGSTALRAPENISVYACCCPCCCAASVPVEFAVQ